MLADPFDQLLRHMEWADSAVWSSVLATPSADADRDLRGILQHLHEVQWAYLQIWRDEKVDIPSRDEFSSIREIFEWGRRYYDACSAFRAEIDADTATREIQFPWARQLIERFGQAVPASFEETVLQITSHSTYHRGQANRRLRELGAKPPLTDFIAWIWMGSPPPQWDVSG